MQLDEIIWKDKFIEKLAVKHSRYGLFVFVRGDTDKIQDLLIVLDLGELPPFGKRFALQFSIVGRRHFLHRSVDC
jgi:hypothetical protein